MRSNSRIDAPKLKRCPFCGDRAYLRTRNTDGHEWEVRCSDAACDVGMWAYDKERVVKDWNRRVRRRKRT